MNQQRAKRFGSQPSYAKEHRMILIEHESSDVELQKRIQEFNTALADHQTPVAHPVRLAAIQESLPAGLHVRFLTEREMRKKTKVLSRL